MRFYCLLFLISLYPFFAEAQFNVSANNNAMSLANNIVGSGASVTSATLNCPNGAIGTFSGGTSANIGLTAGVVLTTGTAVGIKTDADNGWFDANLISVDNFGAGLSSLQTIAGDPTFDACYLDVVLNPICNQIKVKYVFASEEYLDYVNAGVNDAFAFFVSGPNPTGGNYTNKNIALVPGTATPVTINTINNMTNSTYYIDNSNNTSMGYDGMTKPLTASLNVVPCSTYTFRFAIADGGDGIYDSGVFLELDGVSCPINMFASAAPPTICEGTSTTLTASATSISSGTFSWSTGEGGTSIAVAPTSTTVYTCTYTSCSNLSASDTIKVTVLPTEQATFNYPQNGYCIGGSNPTPVDLSNGTNFSASPAGLTFVNATTGEVDMTNTSAGTYIISYPSSGTNCPISATDTITIQNFPQANLSGGGGVCQGDSVALQVNFTGVAPFTFIYSNGAVNTTVNAIFQNPYPLYVSDAGTYFLTGLNDAACAGNVDGFVTTVINPLPTASLSGGGSTCFGDSVALTVAFTGTPPFTFTYSNGTNVISLSDIHQNPYTFYVANTEHDSLISVSDSLCSNNGSGVADVIINPLPSASISGGGARCFGIAANDVVINIQGTAPWNLVYFDGAVESTVVNSSPFTISNPVDGIYTVLSVMDANGCSSGGTDTVTVYSASLPTASISGGGTVCSYDTVPAVSMSFIGTSPWQVTYTDGSSSYTVTLVDSFLQLSNPLAGTYSITSITDSNTCSNTGTGSVDVIINQAPSASISGGGAKCFGVTANDVSINLQGTAPWTLIYLDGTVKSESVNTSPFLISNPADGIYTVLGVLDVNGCSSEGTDTVTVYSAPLPTASISGGGIVCTYDSIPDIFMSFTGTPPWQITYSKDTLTYMLTLVDSFLQITNPLGTYSILSIIDSNTCSNTGTGSIVAAHSPLLTAFAGADTGICPGYVASLTANGGAGGFWTPAPTISGSGSYNFVSAPDTTTDYEFIVFDTYGCSDTDHVTITVFDSPVADFISDVVCEGISTSFVDNSSLSSTTITSYSWDFGDGNNSNSVISTTHSYPACGSYNCTYTITSSNGCVSTITKPVNVACIPVAQMLTSSSVICQNNDVYFQSISYALGSTIDSTMWNFGLGTFEGNSMDAITAHQYINDGSFTVQIAVISAMGCKDTATRLITVNPKPTAWFYNAPVCLNETSFFADSSFVKSPDTITAWNWDFESDGISDDNNQFTSHGYLSDQNATLIVFSSNGCSDTITKPVKIEPLPVPDFNFSNTCEGDLTSFTSLSTIADGSALNYSWDFTNDGIYDTNGNSSGYKYDNDTTYQVKLHVSSPFGCEGSIVKDIQINAKPIVQFGADILNGCAPIRVSFVDSSSVKAGASITAYTWIFGDGDSSLTQNPIHTYSAGSYTVSLIVNTDKGCLDTLIRENYITPFPVPKADFDYQPNNPTVLTPGLQFYDESSNAHIVSWNWSFGDSLRLTSEGNSSLFQDPYHNYQDTGYFDVSLIVKSDMGCIDTVEKTIYIKPDYVIYIPNAFTPNNNGLNEEFKPIAYGIDESRDYNFEIFDRWGQLVFSTEKYNQGWNGNYKSAGAKMATDTYIYKLLVTDVFRKIHTYNGQVQLIR